MCLGFLVDVVFEKNHLPHLCLPPSCAACESPAIAASAAPAGRKTAGGEEGFGRRGGLGRPGLVTCRRGLVLVPDWDGAGTLRCAANFSRRLFTLRKRRTNKERGGHRLPPLHSRFLPARERDCRRPKPAKFTREWSGPLRAATGAARPRGHNGSPASLDQVGESELRRSKSAF